MTFDPQAFVAQWNALSFEQRCALVAAVATAGQQQETERIIALIGYFLVEPQPSIRRTLEALKAAVEAPHER